MFFWMTAVKFNISFANIENNNNSNSYNRFLPWRFMCTIAKLKQWLEMQYTKNPNVRIIIHSLRDSICFSMCKWAHEKKKSPTKSPISILICVQRTRMQQREKCRLMRHKRCLLLQVNRILFNVLLQHIDQIHLDLSR